MFSSNVSIVKSVHIAFLFLSMFALLKCSLGFVGVPLILTEFVDLTGFSAGIFQDFTMESIIQIGESQLGGFLSLNAQNQNQTMDTNGNRQRKSSTSDFEQFPEPIIKSIEIHIRRVSDETG